eukprot:6488956-Amphidinium_carterae.1
MRVWHRRILAGKAEWPLEAMPSNQEEAGGPIHNLKQMVNRLGSVPDVGGWKSTGQWFFWDEATLRAKWDSAQALCAQ